MNPPGFLKQKDGGPVPFFFSGIFLYNGAMSLQPVYDHFAHHDPVILPILKEMSHLKPLALRTDMPLFRLLISDIIGQQLSGKAASTIENRFMQLFATQHLTPDMVLAVSDQTLRDVGLSWAKVKYVKSLAEHVQSGSLNLESLVHAPDEEVIKELTQVKGIGRWTAEMFLLFTLGREDIFSHGDLGLKKGIFHLYGLTEYDQATFTAITNAWQPYRSYGSLATWWSLDNR